MMFAKTLGLLIVFVLVAGEGGIKVDMRRRGSKKRKNLIDEVSDTKSGRKPGIL